MGQPVRKKITETYGEKVGKKPIYTLLIDGNSLLKVSMRDETISDNGEHVGGIFQFLVQLKKLITTRDWDYVYCFFDICNRIRGNRFFTDRGKCFFTIFI